jgi:hypothetical protein
MEPFHLLLFIAIIYVVIVFKIFCVEQVGQVLHYLHQRNLTIQEEEDRTFPSIFDNTNRILNTSLRGLEYSDGGAAPVNQSDSMHSSIFNDTSINYDLLEVPNLSALKAIHCSPSSPCDHDNIHGIYTMYPTHGSVVDNERKILMEFTPKAGCTAAVAMFLNYMGFQYQKVYHAFPHVFRQEYFYQRCGKVNPCMLESSDWYRFKVVRNPYDRVVSSYFHVMKYDILRDEFIPPTLSHKCSFKQYLQLLKEVPHSKMDGFLGGHAGYQVNPLERELFFHNPHKIVLFHKIVKQENFQKDLLDVNLATKSHFKKDDLAFPHFVQRHHGEGHFVGTIPYNFIRNKIPSDYGLFYNTQIRNLVQEIFAFDLMVYNYTFPFALG